MENIVAFNDKSRPRTKGGKDKKRDAYENIYDLYEGREGRGQLLMLLQIEDFN